MNSIVLVLGDTEFEARIAPFTGSRMNELEKASAEYTDIAAQVEQFVDLLKISPEIFDENEDAKAAKPLVAKFQTGKVTEEEFKKGLSKLFGSSLTQTQKDKNYLAWLRFCQVMILETTLTQEQLDAVKSDIAGAFWMAQDVFKIKSAGEFFRGKIQEYST